MTYRQLQKQLAQLSEEQLDRAVTVYDEEEDEVYSCSPSELQSYKGYPEEFDDKDVYLIVTKMYLGIRR